MALFSRAFQLFSALLDQNLLATLKTNQTQIKSKKNIPNIINKVKDTVGQTQYKALFEEISALHPAKKLTQKVVKESKKKKKKHTHTNEIEVEEKERVESQSFVQPQVSYFAFIGVPVLPFESLNQILYVQPRFG